MAQWLRIYLPKQELQETQILSLGQADPLEKEMATLSSILAWETPRTEEPGGLQSMGLQTEEPGGLQSMGLQRVGRD